MAEHDKHILIHGLLDHALDSETVESVHQDMKSQQTLATEYDIASAVKARLGNLPRTQVSEDFLRRVSNIPFAETRWFDGWQRLAGSLLLTAALSSGITYVLFGSRADLVEADAIAASHRRSLLAASPIDIASADSHTVKPWLDAHIGVSPPAMDMKADGFALLGGRVDVIGDRTIPTLVYQHKEHLISVFAAPLRTDDRRQAAPKHLNAGGMNMIHLNENGFSYWVVSDMEWKVLDEFVADYRKSETAN